MKTINKEKEEKKISDKILIECFNYLYPDYIKIENILGDIDENNK